MPQPLIDLTGRRFGRLVVCFRAPVEPGKKPQWVCKCDCPAQTIRIIYGYSLLRGDSTSCGCAQREGMSARRTKHGRRRLANPGAFGEDRRTSSPTYGSWSAMKSRCKDHPRYAGRGIKVCPRWLGPAGFDNFVADMGECPEGMSLNRLSNAGNYCAAKCGGLCGHTESNCEWATHTKQMLDRDHIRRFTDDEVKDIVARTVARQSQEHIARVYSVGRRVIRRVLRDAFATAPRTPTKAPSHRVRLTREVDVAGHIATFRRNGFPWVALADDEGDPLALVRAAKVTVRGDEVVSISGAGQWTCLDANRHRFDARHLGQPSVTAAFAEDEILARAIRYRMGRGYHITARAVLRTLRAMIHAPSNFPPALARWLVDAYAPDGGVVLDPCAGFGGRLLGTVASARNVRYVGFDVEPRTIEGARVLASRVGVVDRVDVACRSAVAPAPWPRADVVLTGPPYFNLEDYGDASRVLHATYEDWRDDFLCGLITRALAAAPVVILNVAHVGKHDMPADVCEIAKGLGARVARVITWPLREFNRRNHPEKILVLRAA